jgi:glycosyltransferase involved in cell wall biosynthesis
MQSLLDGCREAGHETRLYVAAGKTYPRRHDVVPLYPRALSRLYHSRLNGLVNRLAPRAAWMDRRIREVPDAWADLIHVHNFHGDYARIETLAHIARRRPLVWTFHGHWGVTGGCDHPLDCTRYEQSCGRCPRLGVWPLGAEDTTEAEVERKTRALGGLDIDAISPAAYLADRIRRSRVGRHWRVHHIPNGIDTSRFSDARKHDPQFRRELALDALRPVVLVVNRNFRDEQKGFGVISEALGGLGDAARPQIVLAGEGSDWAASRIESSAPVTALGYVASRERMSALFEAADVFLFASPAEVFPCVVLEAMASGCCVVSTPTSGVTEQIEHGRNGLLSERYEGVSLAAPLRAALADAGLRMALGKAARQRAAASFSIDAFIHRHLEVYANAVERRRSGEACRVPA